MKPFHRSDGAYIESTPRRLISLLLMFIIGGCQTWRPASPDVIGVLDRTTPSAVRVTDSRGDRHTIEQPYVSGDSLLAGADGCRSEECRRLGPAGIPIAEVRSVELPGDRDYTLLWAVSAGLALATAGFLYLFAQDEDFFVLGR